MPISPLPVSYFHEGANFHESMNRILGITCNNSGGSVALSDVTIFCEQMRIMAEVLKSGCFAVIVLSQ